MSDTHFLAAAHKVIYRFVHRFGAGAHDHDDALGLRMAHVIEETVVAACALGEGGHHARDDIRTSVVERVRGLAGLEEDVGILGGAPHHGAIGGEGPLAVGQNRVLRDQAREVIVRELLDFR